MDTLTLTAPTEPRKPFRDATSGELVDVGTVKFDLDMNMPGMVMHSGSTIKPTGTPGCTARK